ncbi:MAG: trigger factor [Alphaproteobacteria bacterium]|nr:trigger factor [Alphaproteobacteria bacterium]
MEVTQTLTDGLRREFKVVFPAGEIETKLSERLEGLRLRVQLPGFRPGKVPLQLLRQRFGKSVMGEVVQEALSTGTEEAITKNALRPALQPKIEVTRFDQGTDLEYTVALEVLPDFEPGDFADIQLERLRAEPTGQALDERLGRLAEQQPRYEPVAEGEGAAVRDALVIDYQGTIEGAAFDGGSATDLSVVLGSGQLLAGFEEKLLGAKAGETVVVETTLPETAPKEALRGRPARFEVQVKEVRRRLETAVDDAFAQTLGLENLAALRQAVREQLEREYAAFSRADLKRKLFDALDRRHTFDLPPGMVQAEFNQIWQQVEAERKAGRADPDSEGKSEDEVKAEYQAIAGRRVRLGLLLAEVGRRNNIEVVRDEINRAIAEQARRFPGQERRVFDYFTRTPEAATRLQAPLFEDKVVDFILQKVAVGERTVPLADLVKEVEAPGADTDIAAALAAGSEQGTDQATTASETGASGQD